MKSHELPSAQTWTASDGKRFGSEQCMLGQQATSELSVIGLVGVPQYVMV